MSRTEYIVSIVVEHDHDTPFGSIYDVLEVDDFIEIAGHKVVEVATLEVKDTGDSHE